MAVSDYRKPQNQLIYDLIDETNPGFKDAYPLGSLQFSNMAAIAVDSSDPYKRDTQVVCSGKTGSGVIGRVTVKYRRIDLSTMFRNVSVVLDDWQPSNVTALPRANWTASVANKFGLSVVDADWTSTYGAMTENSAQPTLSVSSLCYKGGITGIVWKRGKRPASDMLNDTNRGLAGRLYPNGNDFTTPGRKPQGEWQTYGQDASAIKTALETVPASWDAPVGHATTEMNQVIAWLNANTGRTNWSNKDASVEGGICGITWFRYTVLPNASVPEANSTRFNRVIVMRAAANSWFAGKIILHYNV